MIDNQAGVSLSSPQVALKEERDEYESSIMTHNNTFTT